MLRPKQFCVCGVGVGSERFPVTISPNICVQHGDRNLLNSTVTIGCRKGSREVRSAQCSTLIRFPL